MNYQEIIESKYNRESWQQLLTDIFRSKAQFWRAPSPVHVSSKIAKEALLLGKISLADGESIAVYEVELNDNVDIERNKRSIRDMLTKDWRDMGHAGAFIFAHRHNESALRFSYVSETWGFNKRGEYERVSTDTMRYTYLLGEGRGCRTAIDQFIKLRDSKQTLQDITEAFSVEALTKKFYNDLFDWFLWAVDSSSGISFPKSASVEKKASDDLEEKIIRLITRIMFVWFIKQKSFIPNQLFDENYLKTILKDFDPNSTTEGNYYNAILQNLFFATLNRAIVDEDGKKRIFAKEDQEDVKTLYRYAEMFSISEQDVVNVFSEVPFLNGGLFECLDKTKVVDGVCITSYNFDGFSQNTSRLADGVYKYRAIVPNALFFTPEKGLFSILNRYNFTIEENTPNEQQIALDPELLGKVFENLLGAYNPETKETARNMSGSFYTPREIVGFMVDESLIAYLGDNDFNRSLFASNFKYDENFEERYLATANKLKAVKVLDPACGSGAFPMGLLNRIVDVLQRILPEEKSYDLKLSIIENCLYGCDIQSIASQITKLRFFISLICDCEKDPSKPNFGIPTLPNLETKFVTADSLHTVKRRKQGNLFEDPEIEITKQKLKQVRRLHFEAKSAKTKRDLRNEDHLLRSNLVKLLAENNDFAPEDACQLASWNPYDQNSVSSFFDPEWMFGLTDGFDIVIGNPPYIQLQNNAGKLANLYEKSGYRTFERKGDIYCLFYERGHQLLKAGGHLCFITSNKWMRAGYGKKTRDFLAKNTNPILLIDFAGVKVFDSATVDTNILLFSQEPNQHKTLCTCASKQDKNSIKNLSVFVQQNAVSNNFATSDSWVILSPIERSIKRKIESIGTPLKDWDIQINYGIKTGSNEAFIISTEKRNEILANCANEAERQRTAELIRPILRGRDIKRYGYEWANLYLIATFPARHYDIEDYPAVKDYFLSFAENNLRTAGYDWVANGYLADFCQQKLAQTGKFVEILGKRIVIGNAPEKARKKTPNRWFEIQDSISYWEDFLKPKVVYPNMTKYLPFYYDKRGFYQNDKSFMITGKHLAFLTAFLNSSLFKYCFVNDFPELQGGTRELRKIFFEKIPVIRIDDSTEALFKELVAKMQDVPCKRIALRLDSLIFDLYELTEKERQQIGFIEIL